jgi:hypothetical protein
MFFITARRFELFNFHGKIYGNVNLEKFIEWSQLQNHVFYAPNIVTTMTYVTKLCVWYDSKYNFFIHFPTLPKWACLIWLHYYIILIISNIIVYTWIPWRLHGRKVGFLINFSHCSRHMAFLTSIYARL